MAVILIYIVAAILSEIVFLVDESLCLSINFKFPLNAIVTPYGVTIASRMPLLAVLLGWCNKNNCFHGC